MKPVGLVRVSCAMGILVLSMACSDHKDKNPVYQVPISDPVNAFKPAGGDEDANLVSSTSVNEGLDCDTPSTEQRLQGPLIGANYRFVSRSVSAPDIPASIVDEEAGYLTEVNGGKFSKFYKLTENSHRGQSAMGGVPLAYTDTCTERGCDQSLRKYTSGSELHAFDVESRITNMRSRETFLPQTRCSFSSDYSARRQSVQRGFINLDGVTYRAVKFTSRQTGTVDCEAGYIQVPRKNGTISRLGSGESVEIEIVLADKLPVSSIVSPRMSNSSRSCERTRVYRSSFYVQGSKVLWGEATDMANARLNGKILGVAEFLAAKQAKADRLKRLNDELMMARSEKSSAELEARKAAALLGDEKVIERDLISKATYAEQLGYRTGSTEADRQAAVEARKKANEQSAKVVILTQTAADKDAIVVIANKRLAEAEENLRNFERQNRP